MNFSDMDVCQSLAFCLLVAIAVGTSADVGFAQTPQLESPSFIDKRTTETANGRVTRGKFQVWENRQSRTGRKIHLKFVVLHAHTKLPKPDPLFYVAGGPGQAVTTISNAFQDHWIRQERDIVMLDQRGTGSDNHLAFDYTVGGSTLQQFFDPIMEPSVVRRNLDRLSKLADLRMYSTPIAADDLNDFRQMMGYEKINLMGGSYGTRACLIYIRRHGETVRTAMLSGCAPIAFKNPLYHAQGAQRALDMMFEEAASTEVYRNAFGNLRRKFEEIVQRLDANPVTIGITNQSTGKSEPIKMNRADFVASVRFQMYYTNESRRLPKLICEAYEGKFRPFVVSSLGQNMALRQSLALGMLLSVTSAEDLARITEDEISQFTADTFIGDDRVRTQLAASKLWPKSELPVNFGAPVLSDVPALILSGTIDPVTPPQWGEMVHKNFPNSVHLVFPTAHDVGGPCVDQIRHQFLNRGTVDGLNTSCIKRMKLPGLVLPN